MLTMSFVQIRFIVIFLVYAINAFVSRKCSFTMQDNNCLKPNVFHVRTFKIVQFCVYLFIYCILVIRHPADGHRSGRNVLLQNNNT